MEPIKFFTLKIISEFFTDFIPFGKEDVQVAKTNAFLLLSKI